MLSQTCALQPGFYTTKDYWVNGAGECTVYRGPVVKEWESVKNKNQISAIFPLNWILATINAEDFDNLNNLAVEN